jgi:dTDP-4-dehydrorhamnose reductase
MRVLVVGSTGAIGHQLSVALSQNGVEVLATSRNTILDKNLVQLDLADISGLVEVIKNQKMFDAAVLCAGVTNLRECERNPDVTSQININSQVTLAESLLKVGTKRVLCLSSSQVFDGETANINKLAKYAPKTEYGRQKAKAETELLKLGQAVRVIRLTKVLSENNSLLKDWVSKLKLGQEIKAFVDVMVSPVTLDDTVRVIADVIESENESVTQFSATDEISYFDMARFLAKFLQVDVGLVAEQNAEEAGERPLGHASLECSKFRSVIPTTSVAALQKVLEKMVSS